MKAVVQRVAEASVTVEGEQVGAIAAGYLVLLGIGHDDTEQNARQMALKISKLRIFRDENEKMNLALGEVNGKVLAVSQFTLMGDTRKGNRPSFIDAARPEQAEPLYECFCRELAALGIPVEKGVFGAKMMVSILNDGPVTVLMET